MCATSLFPLPSTAQELADAIGRDATLALARSVKHRVLYVPRSIDSTYRRGERCCEWIERTIGKELTAKLVKEFGGLQLPLARCAEIEREQRRERIQLAYQSGKSSREIAEEFGLCRRWVKKYYLGFN